MIHDDILWAQFAAAAMTSGDLVGPAASRADLMLKEYKKRWSKHPFKSDNNDDTSSHRPTNSQ